MENLDWKPDKRFLRKILKLRDDEKFTYALGEVRSHPFFRSIAYKVKIDFENSSQKDIFVKDYPTKEIMNSGGKLKVATLHENEFALHKYLSENEGLVPKFISDESEGDHRIIVMESYKHSLEDKLNNKTADVDELKINLFKAIDIYNYNNNILDGWAKDHRWICQKWDKDYLSSESMGFIEAVLDFIVTAGKSRGKWLKENNLRSLFYEVDSHIITPLTQNGKEEFRLFDFIPAHVLLKVEKDIRDHNQDVSDSLFIEKNRNAYRNYALTDYAKVGNVPNAYGIATLINHPSVTQSVNILSLEDEIRDYAIRSYLNSKGQKVEEEAGEYFKRDFNLKYPPSIRLAVLKNIAYICSIYRVYKGEYDKLIQYNPLYEANRFINLNINHALRMPDPEKKFENYYRLLSSLQEVIS